MIWILSLRHGWCGPYLPVHVRDHLQPLAAVGVAGPDFDKVACLQNWAENLEDSIVMVERDPPVGLAIMPDYRLTLRGVDGVPIQLFGFDERPGQARADHGLMLAALCASWMRGGGPVDEF